MRHTRTLDWHVASRCTIAVACLAATLASCGRSADPTQSESQQASTLQPEQDVERVTRHAEIAELIEKLAISNEPAANSPVFTPLQGTPDTDPRVIAYDAAAKLREYGKDAFPQLLANQHDGRQSIALRRVIPHTAGYACYCIVENTLYNLPPDYQGSFYRTGADGELHPRPRFLTEGIFTPDTIDAWLKEREGKSLAEMQIEILEWLIEEERRIGFPTEEDREETLSPLERQVQQLREAMGR
jgi:hypothetical protein